MAFQDQTPNSQNQFKKKWVISGGRINTGILGVKGLRPERDKSGPYIQL